MGARHCANKDASTPKNQRALPRYHFDSSQILQCVLIEVLTFKILPSKEKQDRSASLSYSVPVAPLVLTTSFCGLRRISGNERYFRIPNEDAVHE
jgi:hypothetical protein